jgi:hypothetical protein
MGSTRKQFNENLMIRFLRFLVTNLPERKVVFNIAKGRVTYKRGEVRLKSKLFISVKDPFIRHENHGVHLSDENKFNRLIRKVKEFIHEAAECNIESYIANIIHPKEEDDPIYDPEIEGEAIMIEKE